MVYVPESKACLTVATFAESTTGALASASSSFCRERADDVNVT